MHTFLINTSGMTIENYEEILEIQHETRELVSFDCPILEWNHPDYGYKKCVRKMGEAIDSFKEINNDFNLILYVDLTVFELYASIPLREHRERYACLEAMHAVFKRYLTDTMLKELENQGRIPGEILVIFEENQKPEDGDVRTEDGRNRLRKYIKRLLGITDEEAFCSFMKRMAEEDATTESERFLPELKRLCANETLEGMHLCYVENLDIFLEECRMNKEMQELLELFCDRVEKCGEIKAFYMETISFITNRRAGIDNKQERTQRDLRLCFYIMECVKDCTIYLKEDGRTVKCFPEIDWKQVVLEMETKKAIFERKYKEIEGFIESFSKLQLAPELYVFDHERFALDEHGKQLKTYEVVDEEKATTKKKKKDEDFPDGDIKKAVEVLDAPCRPVFDEDEYPLFDYEGNTIDDNFHYRTTPEEFIKGAYQLREHHMSYLKRLKAHISERLSNYSGRSEENEPALLRKRRVSINEDDFDDFGREYRYAKYTGSGSAAKGITERKKLKTVQDISRSSYISAVERYLDFCAARTVALTDIEEQCDWLITRMYQIRESLKRLVKVAIGSAVGLVISYIPFLVLQWAKITESLVTLLIAMGSMSVPLLVLGGVFGAMAAAQRKKYFKAWKEFKQISDEALKENAAAAMKFDQLLNTYAPGLRWLYEYKLDVEFYAECCKIAKAKLQHHKERMHDRIEALGNLGEDLERIENVKVQAVIKARDKINDEVDYNLAFCAGDKNPEFYAIIERDFLESLRKRKEA